VSKELVVGVIGGLGPEATLDFYAKVLKNSRAAKDQDHLHVIIESNPKTPNRNDALAGHGPSPAPALQDMARALERAGADFVVMACNTAHAFEPDIRSALNVPFVSLISELVEEVKRVMPHVKKVGILATQGSRDANIFAPAFAKQGIDVIQLNEVSQRRFMQALYEIKSGDRSEKIRQDMLRFGDELIEDGADILIAGCTEVPLVLSDGDNSKTLIDSTDVLARRCIVYARGLEKLPTVQET
jgi:aspartate racemase